MPAPSIAAPIVNLGTPYLSVVIPVYNEQDNLRPLFDRLTRVMDDCGHSYEIIFTNDGSKDKSSEILCELHKARPKQVRVIEFNRNYGQHMAIMAAFERARGEYIINLDADMQNPPEEIPKLIEKINAGHDVVNSFRMDRQDSWFRNNISRFANKVRYLISGIQVADMGCMLRAYHKDIAKQITQSQEASTFITLLAQMYAANPAEVGVKHAAREAGKSNYNLYKLLRYNFDMMTSVSIVPLQFFTIIGMAVSALSGLLVAYMLLRRLIIGPEAEGLFTLFAIAFFLMGVIITGLGIVGEYVGRIYQTVRARPRYSIKTIHEDI